MIGLILVGILGAFGVFTPVKEPGLGAAEEPAEPVASVAKRPRPAASANRRPNPRKDAAAAADQVGASHVLIAYQGATRAKPNVTRTKEQAKKLAEQVAARIKKGEDFAKVAQELSDCSSKSKGGDLGTFTRDRMTPAFSQAAFALKVGEMSGVVETPFGFHVIKRTQ